MDLEIVLKLLAVLVSSVGAWKVLTELARARRATLREEYRFAKEFLSDLKSKEPIHVYLKDKGYEALGGDKSLATREIEYLMSLPEPARALREYANGRKYIEHVATAGDRQLLLRRPYRRFVSLRSLIWLYLALFLLAYTAAWSPLVFSEVPRALGFRITVALPFTLLTFGPISYWFFRQGSRVSDAWSLLRRTGVHTEKR